MHRVLVCVPLFFVALLLGACTADQGAARARLMETSSAWSWAAQAHDLEAAMATYAADAVVLAPEVPPLKGKDTIRGCVKGVLSFPGLTVGWTPTHAEIGAAGGLAYFTEETFATQEDGSDGNTTTFGKSVRIWRRQPDGSWKCIVDIWNNPPAE